jgi:hypothetical protein
MSYNPIPPRVWSRVQNPCTYIDASGNYNQVYIPLTNQTVSQAQANYEDKMVYKGNVLQYKGNSSRLTKSQKYTQLAKGFGPNRTKVFASQSQTYTNPNTTGLQRVNYSTIPFPNAAVGEPNNISGPYQYNVTNPNGCSGTSIQDGGNLRYGYYANPCTGEIINSCPTSSTICNPASASDVPGSSILCWNTKVQPWFPKPRYVMNNSTDKWPVNYKGLVSATRPESPYLMIDSSSCNSVTLSWVNVNSICIPISAYNIYQNGVLIKNVRYTTTSTTINGLVPGITYSFFITSVSNTIESLPSNTVVFNKQFPFITTGTSSYTVDSNCNYLVTFTGNGTITFTSSLNINIIAVGGGGGGGGGSNNQAGNLTESAGGGGGGGGVGILNSFTVSTGTVYNISIGTLGLAGSGNNGGNDGGNSSFKDSFSTNYLTATGGGAGKGHFLGCFGGFDGSANSINAITTYSGANGGNGYQTSPSSIAQNGSNIVPGMPIGPLPNGSTYSFSGGGGGGVYTSTFYGGLAGLNGSGGTLGAYTSPFNGQNASSYGSGGGGAGCPAVPGTPSNGGVGANGIVIIYFTY